MRPPQCFERARLLYQKSSSESASHAAQCCAAGISVAVTPSSCSVARKQVTYSYGAGALFTSVTASRIAHAGHAAGGACSLRRTINANASRRYAALQAAQGAWVRVGVGVRSAASIMAIERVYLACNAVARHTVSNAGYPRFAIEGAAFVWFQHTFFFQHFEDGFVVVSARNFGAENFR
jgi:hypothetical protein